MNLVFETRISAPQEMGRKREIGSLTCDYTASAIAYSSLSKAKVDKRLLPSYVDSLEPTMFVGVAATVAQGGPV